MTRYTLLLLVCLGPLSLRAQGYFDFNTSARDAYSKAISLRLPEARTAVQTMANREKNNLIAVFIENYIEFIAIFSTDDRTAHRDFNKKLSERIAAIRKGDSSSPYYRYCQAEMKLQSAALNGRFGNTFSAMTQAKQAYNLLNENDRYFPNFIANKKSLGILHAIIGNIPPEYQWAVRAVGGMSGSIDQGLQEIEQVIQYTRQNDFIFREETYVAYAFLQLFLRNKEESAWQTLQQGNLDTHNNPLAAFVMANLALRVGKVNEAIQLLENSNPGQPFPYRLFLLGTAKLYRLDADANQPIQQFIKQFTGKNGLKDAYQKLAWYHLSRGNENGYRTYMGYVKIKGIAHTEPDKSAQREAESGKIPDQKLLKARLLFDGGSYQRAYDLLKNAASEYQNQPDFQLEYYYRMGRIAHKMKKNSEAELLYRKTVDIGRQLPWYFACNAALQLGLLFEEKRDYFRAKAAFQECLDIEPKEYAAGLHARAKAGLNRLKKY